MTVVGILSGKKNLNHLKESQSLGEGLEVGDSFLTGGCIKGGAFQVAQWKESAPKTGNAGDMGLIPGSGRSS